MAKTPEEKAREKQLRAKARRAAKTKKARRLEKAVSELYKPIEEWDAEELARGRPKGIDGRFHGPAPTWINRQTHEEAVRRFKDMANSDMRALVPMALDMVRFLLTSDDVDERGRLVVPAGVKLDAAKWTVEHLVGKPTQRTELDISERLQAALAASMVMPNEQGALGPAIEVEWAEVEDED